MLNLSSPHKRRSSILRNRGSVFFISKTKRRSLMTHTLTPDALRIVRNVCDLTQQQLADLIFVDRSTITKIEAGSRSITPEICRAEDTAPRKRGKQ
ncbi:helix-turn-helix transcriptional regulator [Paenibacillus sp. NPDC056722]|uniref:helix-turn-helix transcriptional regulator n=1 Tax=Paenibacillus sp. NPDC056722 TaxID=3345924 RepID=UPI0036BDA29C